MWKTVTLILLILSQIALIFYWSHGSKIIVSPAKVCTLESRICPDGTVSSRQGPNCQFPVCSDVVTAPGQGIPSNNVTLGVGEHAEIVGIDITLNRIISDSRCPIDATCIQEGNVLVEVLLGSSRTKETADISSNGIPYQFGGDKISIKLVTPDKTRRDKISNEQYKITFHIDQ